MSKKSTNLCLGDLERAQSFRSLSGPSRGLGQTTAERVSGERKRDRTYERPIPHQRRSRRYFLLFALFSRAVELYRLLKHFRQRRSRRLMKLGARSSEPQ